MMKKRTYQKKTFESTGSKSDVSANIYLSMIISEAWLSLTKSQRLLYIYMKLQNYAQKNKPYSETNTAFFFNKSKWMSQYKLYNKGNENGFYRDVTALIEKGFIKCVSSGKVTRDMNIYDYSDKWQKYSINKPVKLECNEMNMTLLHRLNKVNETTTK